MNRTIIVAFFSILFLSLITAPTILMTIDSSIDISLLYDISEEEEDKGSEKNKEFEVCVFELNSETEDLSITDDKEYLGYSYKNYPKPHLNLISPPPEFIL
ncbi:hypothetical protein A9Q86_06575 [Flavobacteriales bacterium 33_180_T64]|nr:hypothetical protein A9Q86_06575 [Flavobacteriales bacterium 33_180_T64]